MKAAVLVNGVPASGKSVVARAIADKTGWPLLALDTIKEAFFNHLGTGDRDYNRTLGKASYEAIFSSIAGFPEGSTTVIDAWFGFQPLEVLSQHLARAGIGRVVEAWCHAPPDVIGNRFAARVATRSSGHLGADYVPELIELARVAKPVGKYPLIDVNTTQVLDAGELVEEVRTAMSAGLT